MTDFDLEVKAIDLIIRIELSAKGAHWKANRKHMIAGWKEIIDLHPDHQEHKNRLIDLMDKIERELA